MNDCWVVDANPFPDYVNDGLGTVCVQDTCRYDSAMLGSATLGVAVLGIPCDPYFKAPGELQWQNQTS